MPYIQARTIPRIANPLTPLPLANYHCYYCYCNRLPLPRYHLPLLLITVQYSLCWFMLISNLTAHYCYCVTATTERIPSIIGRGLKGSCMHCKKRMWKRKKDFTSGSNGWWVARSVVGGYLTEVTRSRPAPWLIVVVTYSISFKWQRRRWKNLGLRKPKSYHSYHT